MNEKSEGIITLQGFIESIPVSNLLLFLSKLQKTGILKFMFKEAVKSLYFKNGKVVFATSSIDDDRLGESLIRNGKITEEQLKIAAKEISPSRKLGKILVDKGFITAKDLFLGVRVQIEEIVVSLFQFDSGYFEFKEGNFTDLAASIPINLMNAILKGLRKSNKKARLHSLLPSFDTFLGVRENITDLELDQKENEVINYVKARKTVNEIIALKDMELTDALLRLLSLEVLYPAARAPVDKYGKEDEIEELLKNVNSILMDIYTIIKTKSPERDVHKTLNTFFMNISPKFKEIFDGVELKKDGSIDISKIIKNKLRIKDGGQELVNLAISELLQFELFELRHYLNREEEKELMELLKEFRFER